MSWYSGTIANAIAESKAASKLFVVHISGNDADSQQMDSVWESTRITEFCKAKCICLKLKNDSVDCKQFTEFYPVLIIPCTYMIGINGMPLEIIGGLTNESTLLEKLENAFQSLLPIENEQSDGASSNIQPFSTEQTSQAAATTSVQQNQPHTSNNSLANQAAPGTSLQEDEKVNEDISEQGDSNRAVSTSGPVYSDEDIAGIDKTLEAGSSTVSASEKAKKLQEKLKSYREEKAAQNEKNERVKEIARRTTGKQIQEMKAKQQEVKRELELAEKRKEKALEREALDRVRSDIARDRAEKKKKFESELEERNREKEKKIKERNERLEKEKEELNEERNKTARIQYRFPDASTLTRKYDSSLMLSACVADLLEQAPPALPRDFELFTTLPNHVFSSEDMNKLVSDLQLVPSASIYVRPKRRTLVQSNSGDNLFSKIFAFLWLLLSLPLQLFKKLWDFIMAPSTNNRSNPPPAPASSSSGVGSNPDRPYGLRQRKPTNTGRATVNEGNVRRLHDVRKDDDDEQATWNGNSTQQM